MRSLLALVTLVLTAPALACSQNGCGTTGRALWPPPPYDKFDGSAQIQIANDMEEMGMWCAPHPLRFKLRACSFRVARPGQPVWCQVYIAPPSYLARSGDTVDDLIRHELGHCAGWPADHPR